MYCNGPQEHYIDIACPFGKTNSPLEFCPPVALFAKSVAYRYADVFNTAAPVLGTHVDDIFGGFKRNGSFEPARHFREFMCSTGAFLTITFNLEVSKTPPPAKRQKILGRIFDSVTRRVTTAPDKREKYLVRLRAMCRDATTTRKLLEKLHGNLAYAAGVEPFGRPFLAPLTTAMCGSKEGDAIVLPSQAKMGLRV